MTNPAFTPERWARTSPFRHALIRAMKLRGHTQATLGAAMSVSPTMVGYWRQGRYLPSTERADQLATILNFEPLREIVRHARIGRCPVCQRAFDKRGKRLYCTLTCQRRANAGAPLVHHDPRQAAIDAFCGGCEPEGICRDDTCALRAFSPYPFIPLHKVRVA